MIHRKHLVANKQDLKERYHVNFVFGINLLTLFFFFEYTITCSRFSHRNWSICSCNGVLKQKTWKLMRWMQHHWWTLWYCSWLVLSRQKNIFVDKLQELYIQQLYCIVWKGQDFSLFHSNHSRLSLSLSLYQQCSSSFLSLVNCKKVTFFFFWQLHYFSASLKNIPHSVWRSL